MYNILYVVRLIHDGFHLQNFYLVDPHLLGFILAVLVRRLIYSLLAHMVVIWAPPPLWTLLEQLIR